MSQKQETKSREFTLRFSKNTYDWFVLIQPTIKTEDGYEARVIEFQAYQEAQAKIKELKSSLFDAGLDIKKLQDDLTQEKNWYQAALSELTKSKAREARLVQELAAHIGMEEVDFILNGKKND